jgi:hypothetical protein
MLSGCCRVMRRNRLLQWPSKRRHTGPATARHRATTPPRSKYPPVPTPVPVPAPQRPRCTAVVRAAPHGSGTASAGTAALPHAAYSSITAYPLQQHCRRRPAAAYSARTGAAQQLLLCLPCCRPPILNPEPQPQARNVQAPHTMSGSRTLPSSHACEHQRKRSSSARVTPAPCAP